MRVGPHKKGLRTKIVLAMLIVGFIPMLVGLVIAYWNGTLRLRESMGKNFQGLATEASRKADLVIEREIEGKKHLSITTDIRAAIEASNQSYQGLSTQNVKERLAQMKNRWEGGDQSLREGILLVNASVYLRNYMVTKGGKYIAFFATDQEGAIVASVNGYPGYIYSQEDWWKETYNDGLGKVYIGDLYFSEKAQAWAINIAVPVMDERTRKVIGVLAVFHDVQGLLKRPIHDIRFGKTGHAMLIDSNGRVLTCPFLATGLLMEKKLAANVTSPTPGWVMAEDDGHGGKDSIIGFSPAVETSEITANSTGKRWHSFIRQDPKELYAPINSLLLSVSLSGIFLIGFVAFMGVVISKKLAKPIQVLQEGAEEIGKGNLDVKLNIRTNDEIEQLANGFNRMAEKLKESYSTLEQKVDERTRQLTALNMIATTTNRSLELQEILGSTLDKVLEVMQFQAGAIRLLDATEEKLVLQVSRGLPSDFIQKYKEVSAGEMIAGQVALSGRPVIIEDAQKFPQPVSPIMDLGFVSIVAIPLKSKDKVLGTLTGASRAPRSFSPQDLELLVSIGNQLSIAIENATLYTKAKAMVEQLKETDRFKSEFFSNISHELRAPLTSIIGYSELLLDRITGELNTKQGEYISNIEGSGAHLLGIINNLLDLSRIRAGKMEIHFGEFSLRNLVLSCIKAVTPLASKKGQNLESRIEEGSLMINADEIKVKQILINLLSNAGKFTHHGGSIMIDARSSLLDGQPAVEVSVTDNGIGIKQEDRHKIFEEFRQADSSYTREYPGSGLGLPITKQFVEMHGGQIRVESQFGKGSRFAFVLPKRIEPERSVQEEVPEAVTITGSSFEAEEVGITTQVDAPSNILVVEDDPQSSQLLTLYLGGLGYQIHHAASGKEAIEKARELKPFAITLDILLPDRDGWEVLRTLKSMPETCEIPIIIVSTVENREMGLSLGALDYLTKPIDREMLLECFNKHNLITKVKYRPMTILLVDDDPLILDFLGSFLEAERFGVIKSQGGAEGIDLAVRLRPDLIILDLVMPGMDGFEFVRRLKQYPLVAHIPILIVTQKDLSVEERDFLRDEVMEVIPKGKTLKENLINEIRKVEQLYPEKARMIDSLTGLYNERYLEGFLRYQSERGLELKRPFSILVTRIDHFKAYNEKKGRSSGDKVIREVAKVFRRSLRSPDLVCRCYGSTFGIVLPETAKETAITIGRKLKGQVEGNPASELKTEVGESLTLSVGVATFFRDAKTVEAFLNRTRQALDEAERQGGNRIITT